MACHMESTVDVAVVGAGPAGGMAARTVARAGFAVTILDRRRKVGLPVQCGEGVSSLALESNGLPTDGGWISKRIAGAKLKFPGNTWCYITRAGGYSLHREKFDQWIVRDAVDLGAELRLRTALQRLERLDDGWYLRTNRGVHRASLLIGADGPHSTVAAALGWIREREWLNTLEYRFREEDFDYPDNDHFNLYASTAFHGGYAWVFPKEGEFNVGVGSPFPVKRMVRDFCTSLGVEVNKARDLIGGLIPHRFEMRHFADEGVALAGDAAGLTNPLSGGGIHPALFSGRIAGEWAVKALGAEDPSVIEGYERELVASSFLDPVLWEASYDSSEWEEEAMAYLGSRVNGKSLSEITRLDAVRAFLRRPLYLRYVRKLATLYRAVRISAEFGW